MLGVWVLVVASFASSFVLGRFELSRGSSHLLVFMVARGPWREQCFALVQQARWFPPLKFLWSVLLTRLVLLGASWFGMASSLHRAAGIVVVCRKKKRKLSK